jgi:translation initiation factor 4B
MSRTNSRTASERSPLVSTRTPPPPGSSGTHTPTSPQLAHAQPKAPNPALAPSVRPTLSFANAAKKDAALLDKKFEESAGDENKNIVVEEVAEKVADVAI